MDHVCPDEPNDVEGLLGQRARRVVLQYSVQVL